jgi:tetratricopeptide (TPR) repeat protein
VRRQAWRLCAWSQRLAVAALATLLLFASANQAWAAGIQTTREYAACMRLARISPQEGFETALGWADAGGGGAAKHCAAVALFSMGQFREAAARFEALAATLADKPEVRASLLAQAGQAWHQAGEIDGAFAAYSAAVVLSPGDPQLRVDRAMVSAERGQYWMAIDDLNVSLDADRNMVEALVLRASAFRFLDSLDLALQDVARALELSPRYPEALLERGNILRLQGEIAGARRDWLTLVRLYEGTPAADAARRNIETLDVKTE